MTRFRGFVRAQLDAEERRRQIAMSFGYLAMAARERAGIAEARARGVVDVGHLAYLRGRHQWALSAARALRRVDDVDIRAPLRLGLARYGILPGRE